MNRRTLLAAGLGLLAATGCKKKDQSGHEQLPFDHIGVIRSPGFGKNEGAPVGTPFELPKGIHLVSRSHLPFDPSINKLFGNANTFYTDISLVPDSTWGGGFVEFPPALVMLSVAPDRIQNGVLMDRIRITIPPIYNGSGGDDTVTVYLGVVCMNSNLAFPWEENFEEDIKDYPIGKGMYRPYVISTDPEVLKFISLLENRPNLKLTKHHNPKDVLDEDYVEPEWMKPYNEIQMKFWELTNGDGLSKEEIKELLEILDKV
jgi:hypothetical protein